MRCLDTGPNRRTQQYRAIFAIRPSIRRCGARRNGAHGWAQNWAQRRKFSSTRENPEATNAMIQKKKYGGRDRDRTGDPLLAKNRSPLQSFSPLFWFPMFSTIWGICFSLEAKPNAMKPFDSCTVRAQSPISIGDRVQFRRPERLSSKEARRICKCFAEQLLTGFLS
jgi:hypothetical protein